jgi:hypothetical protein
MIKTSTFIYSIHNLASQTYQELIPDSDLDGKKEFGMVYKAIDQIPLSDVRQEVVNDILNSIDDIV